MSRHNKAKSLCIEESTDHKIMGKNFVDDAKMDFKNIKMLEKHIEKKSNEPCKINRERVERALAVNDLEHMLSLKVDRIIANITRAVALSRCDGKRGFELGYSDRKHLLIIIKAIRNMMTTCIKRESLEEERVRLLLSGLHKNMPSPDIMMSGILCSDELVEKVNRDADEMLFAAENLAEAISSKRKRIETRRSSCASHCAFKRCWLLQANDDLEVLHTIEGLEAAISEYEIKDR